MPPKLPGGSSPRGRGGNVGRKLIAIVVGLTMLIALLVVVCAMALFARKIRDIEKGCGDPSLTQATPVSTSIDLGSGPDAPGAGNPPRNFIPAYFAAANQPDAQLGPLGPYVLMGIHQVESGFGRSTLDGVHAGANFLGCCKGPFQFYDKPGEWSTWLAKSPVSGKPYARDGDSDGNADIYNNIDSMFAAGALLYASGAPGDWKGALFSYNRSTAYGEEVLEHARYYEAHVTPPGAGKPPPAHGDPDFELPEKPKAEPDEQPDPAADAQANATLASLSSDCSAEPEELVAAVDGGPYTPPLTGGYIISTPFWEWREDDLGSYNHEGVDLAIDEGTPIHAIGDGTVRIAGVVSGYGNYTCIDHTQGMDSCYGHQSRIDVQVGDKVKRGQVIGLVGTTGFSTGAHLHFEIHLNEAPVCPANYVGMDPSVWCEPNAPGFNAKPDTGAQPA
jgi:murein DD-endopeptidase MepM/ murein hydrolase activator NlpD